jgi:hypothetical protein
MLKHGEVNPLNVHGLRQLKHCPLHFERVEFVPIVTVKHLSDWVFENLEGRFYVGNIDTPQQRLAVVAFELASEASYFSLLLPQINTF